MAVTNAQITEARAAVAAAELTLTQNQVARAAAQAVDQGAVTAAQGNLNILLAQQRSDAAADAAAKAAAAAAPAPAPAPAPAQA
jgi:hypothetical protein